MQQNKYLPAFLLFFIFLIVYFLGSFSKIPFADCMGFVLDTEKGNYVNIATATTHFLYINSAIFIKQIFGINAIFANRILVVFSAALTVSLIYLIVFELIQKQWIAIVTAFVFGFSFSFWKNAEIVEVYTFNAFWVSLYFLFLIKSLKFKTTSFIFFTGFFLGLGLFSHIQNILLIPSYLLMLFYLRANKKSVMVSFLAFLFFCIMLFAINITHGLAPKMVYSSDQGHWVEDSFTKSFSIYLLDFIKSILYLIYNYNIFIFFGFVGILKLYKSNKPIFYTFALASFFVYGFATFYAVSDNYVFFIPFNIMFSIGIGFGLNFYSNKKWFLKLSPICLMIPLFYLLSFQLISLTKKGQDFNAFKTYKGGLHYYLYPWMNDNVGILEFTIEKRKANEAVSWMTASAEEYIKILKTKHFSDDQIKKL